ncbi:MAG TPA: M14 family zinc carboxypeptidase, partial [Chitinophagaceae bacterium]|nr:M14 family zinc carboxypeptidase [Chitinophagaceae bacterium]
MWFKKCNCVLLLLLGCFLNSKAQEKYSKVKVTIPTTLQERNKLLGLLEIDHFYQQDGAIISEISDRVLKKLIASNAPFQILVDDVAKNLQEENSRYYASKREGTHLPNARVAFEQKGANLDAIIKVPAPFVVQNTFGGYYNYAQMSTAMDKMVISYPGLVQKISIGKSAELRDIWASKISDNVTADEEGEPEVLYTGLQHAREAIGGSSLIFFMEYLLENYEKDIRIKNLVDNREFYIIPCVNPDGWEYNRSLNANGGGGWRKNRSKVDSVVIITPAKGKNPADTSVTYEYGVDLNRNYGIDWGNCP